MKMRRILNAPSRAWHSGLALFVLALWAAPLLGQQTRVVHGQVLDTVGHAPLGGVVIRAVDTPSTAVTDSSGTFKLRVPAGVVRLTLEGIGIRPDTVSVGADETTVTIYAEQRPVELSPMTVRVTRHVAVPARARFDTLAQPSTVTLSGVQITQAPALLEPDVIRAVQLLPGTVARNDYSIGYDVRGGGVDQNLVQLDGVTVFNPSHLGGLFSIFDANAVDHVTFLTGGFPATYSGRLSSVLDVSIRDGDHQHIKGSGSVSLLSSKLLVEGPVGPASFLLSARRTYADQVVKLVSSKTLPYYFTDLLGKLDLPYGTRGDLSVTGYWGRDVLSPTLVAATAGQPAIGLKFDWGNALLGLDWRQPLGSALFEQRVSVTTFSSDFALQPNFVSYGNPASLWSSSSTLSFAPGGDQHLTIGAQLERYDISYSQSNPAVANPLSADANGMLGFGLSPAFFDTRYHPSVLAGFFDDQWRPNARVLLRGGVRVSRVDGAGVTDVAPRASFKVFLTPDQALTGSVGSYYQVVQSLSNQNSPFSIYQFWVGANGRIPVAHSDQVVLGYDRWFGSTELAIEGYEKTFDHLIRPNDNLALRDTGSVYLPVSGNAWGADVLLRRHVGRVRGWIAYSFLHTIRRSAGLTYPPLQDRSQTVNIVLDAPGPWHSDLGVRLGYGSPEPYTSMIGTWAHGGYSPTYGSFTHDPQMQPVLGPLDGARYPSYERVDVGLRWHSRHSSLTWNPYVNVLNVLDRRNVFAYIYDGQDVPPKYAVIYQLPILLTFGLDFSW